MLATTLSVATGDILARRTLELKYQFRFRLVDFAAQICSQMIPVGGAVLMVYLGIFLPIHDLAGKSTAANFGLAMFADVRPSELASYTFGLLGWIFGMNAQRLRKNTTERLAAQNAELEQLKDPDRSSSGLTKRGQTPPEVAK